MGPGANYYAGGGPPNHPDGEKILVGRVIKNVIMLAADHSEKKKKNRSLEILLVLDY